MSFLQRSLLPLALILMMGGAWLALTMETVAPFELDGTYVFQRWAPGASVDEEPFQTGALTVRPSGPGWTAQGTVDDQSFEGVGLYDESSGVLTFSLTGARGAQAKTVTLQPDGERMRGHWAPVNVAFDEQGDLLPPDAKGVEIWTPSR